MYYRYLIGLVALAFGAWLAVCAYRVYDFVNRPGTGPLGRDSPSDQPRHRVAAGMIWTQALREEHQDGHDRSVNPPLPKKSCRAERLENTLFGQQSRKIKRLVTVGRPDGLAK